MKEKFIKFTLTIVVSVFIVSILGLVVFKSAQAETSGSSPESGVVSRIKTLYTTLQIATYGSDTDSPDWGAYWNRIKTASSWIPTGDSAVTDVKSGKTFFNGTRTAQTGTYLNPTNCSSQAWPDSNASATEGNNCSLTWTTSSAPVTGDDNRSGRGGLDPRTGLVWSQLLLKTGTAIGFSTGSNTTFSWDSSAAENRGITSPVAGNRTAKQLCTDQGNGWRLPSQKELMQAYIDGFYWNLTQSSNYFWTATEFGATDVWYMQFASGTTNYASKTASVPIRCVR